MQRQWDRPCPYFVEHSEACKLDVGDGGCRLAADVGVGVGWVPHHQYFDRLLRDSIK
jgi:hypothetical protein